MEPNESIYFQAAAKAVGLFGFKVQYYENVHILKIISCDQTNSTFYIDNVPKSTNYKNLITCIVKENYLKLNFANGKILSIDLKYTHILIDKRYSYYKTTLISGSCKGIILDNNNYINFKCNGWINSNYKAIISGESDLLKRDDPILLDLKFNLVKPIKVNIFNEGQKMVIHCGIQHYLSNVFNFTIFSYNDEYLIADKIYKNSYRFDLFDYVAEDGELFTTLLDCKTNTINLVSNTKSIPTKKLSDYMVDKENDYNIVLENAYCYNYEWFTIDQFKGTITKISVKKSKSGKITKPALSYNYTVT